jgi:hypothetical protein
MLGTLVRQPYGTYNRIVEEVQSLPCSNSVPEVPNSRAVGGRTVSRLLPVCQPAGKDEGFRYENKSTKIPLSESPHSDAPGNVEVLMWSWK